MDRLGQSLEDYLEAIYLISKERKVVRITEIADRLGVKKTQRCGCGEEAQGFGACGTGEVRLH